MTSFGFQSPDVPRLLRTTRDVVARLSQSQARWLAASNSSQPHRAAFDACFDDVHWLLLIQLSMRSAHRHWGRATM